MEKPTRTDPIGEVIAANLRAWRLQHDLKLEDAARRLSPFLEKDVSASSLQQWESTSSPRRFTMQELYAICRVTGRPLAVLLLPDLREPPYPKIAGEPYDTIWKWCFQPQVDDAKEGNTIEGFWRSLHLWQPGSPKDKS